MSEIITISNSVLIVKISTKGAEILSVKKDGVENIRNQAPDLWDGHAPVLFPICGRLKDGYYIYDGKKYEMGMHGFASESEFKIEEKSENAVTFLLVANEETKKIYPFLFEFRVKYTLDASSVSVSYITKNTDNKLMYFSVGSHEAYTCPEGVEEYSIEFDEEEDLKYALLDEAFLNGKYETFGTAKELALKYRHFDIDTLVFLDLKSRRVTLKNRSTGRKIDILYEGADNLLIWTMDTAKFLCIEPWCGLPDYTDTDHELVNKPGMIKLKPNEVDMREHTIIF